MLRFVVFLAFFAAVVYAFFWLLDRRRNQGGGGGKGARRVPPGPIGPDDDESFLRELDWKQRHPRRTGDDEKPA